MRITVTRVFQTGAVAALTVLAGCGGGSSGGGNGGTYNIGGTVIGMEKGGTVDLVSGSASLSVTSNGTFTFPAAVDNGTNYDVTIETAPTGQNCAVLNNGGEIDSASVTNVEAFCTMNVSPATLNGDYEIAVYNISSDSDQLYTAVPFNGSGTEGSSTVLTNQAGTTFTTSTDAGGTYAVTTVDALPALTIGANNVGAIAGADGDEFYLVDNGNIGGSQPALVLGVKPLQTATSGALAGNWLAVGLTQATTPYGSEESIAIASDGSFNGTETTLDITGAANTLSVSGPAGTYGVTNNVVSVEGNSGYISANGEFAILTAVTQSGGGGVNYPGLTAMLKLGSGVTLATLSGVYSVGSMSYDNASTGAGSTLTLFLDGAGNFTATTTSNNNGSYSSGSASGTYSVTSSGVLTLTDSSGNVSTGGVTADGNIVELAYLTAAAAAPEIFVGFRQ
jgi:hypothetical protein